jgi:hypothetical protein
MHRPPHASVAGEHVRRDEDDPAAAPSPDETTTVIDVDAPAGEWSQRVAQLGLRDVGERPASPPASEPRTAAGGRPSSRPMPARISASSSSKRGAPAPLGQLQPRDDAHDCRHDRRHDRGSQPAERHRTLLGSVRRARAPPDDRRPFLDRHPPAARWPLPTRDRGRSAMGERRLVRAMYGAPEGGGSDRRIRGCPRPTDPSASRRPPVAGRGGTFRRHPSTGEVPSPSHAPPASPKGHHGTYPGVATFVQMRRIP